MSTPSTPSVVNKALTRRPTLDDFESNREFCVVSLSAGPKGFRAEVLTRNAKIKREFHHILLGEYGKIDYIELGKYRPQISRFCEELGLIIDYAELEKEVMKTATEILRSMKGEYLSNLDALRAQLQSLPIEV